ncbi:MAG: RagB/SusD family nutrient uptake outer membrane protein [Bacteroidales bacterium]|nr:RagB/SusD family nutrient uptake outer membrane protein [Bacteroidales bacterium]MCF8389184.1 RagB/SusD family nutrient uptake outer membrane protein [Bacteroidales bacterium]
MNSKRSISILFGLVLMLSSCEKFLEPQRDNRLSEEQVFGNPIFAEGLLLNAYEGLPSSYVDSDLATDNAVTNEMGSNLLRMATGEWKSSTANPVGSWNDAYTQIYYLNLFLERLYDVEWSWERKEVNDLFIKRLKGEAYALRALYEFYLLQAHSGISESGELLGFPIITEVLTVEDDLKLPRDTYEDCLIQILADCDTAISNLTDKYVDTGDPIFDQVYGSSYQNRMNATIVRALISRISLHAASPSYTIDLSDQEKLERWETAAKSAGEMLASIGGVAGLSAGGHLFYLPVTIPALIIDKDIIWRNDYDLSNAIERNNYPPSLFGRGRTNPSQNLVDAFPMKNGYPIEDLALSGFDATKPYTNRDPRLEAYIVYNGNRLRKFIPINTSNDGGKDGIKSTTESTRTGYYLKKFMNPDVNVDPSSTNQAIHFHVYFRYTEIFLNYAEAANEAWGPDGDPNGYGFSARDIVLAIRQRAGIDQPDNYVGGLASKVEFRELVQNERRLELCFEDFRFWDLRRWGLPLNEACMGVYINDGGATFDYQLIENRNYADYMIYGPIPYDEILKYNLSQNKGWE